MWKKIDITPTATPAPPPESRPTRTEPVKPPPPPTERATIGRSIVVQGEVMGDEDLLIRGRVEGSVNLALHTVTVGNDGEVKASISARVVAVEGEVEGDLQAEEQVVLRSSARVQGDIRAPRVVLEDGAIFRGLVDMGEPVEEKKLRGDSQRERPEAATTASRSPQAGPRGVETPTETMVGASS